MHRPVTKRPPKPNRPLRACTSCGQAFEPAWPRQRHCRPSCRGRSSGQQRSPAPAARGLFD